MILKLGMQHKGLEVYKVCIVTDLCYGKVKFGCLCILIGKTVRKSFTGKPCSKWPHIDKLFKVLKKRNKLRRLCTPDLGLNACIWPLFSNIFFIEANLHHKVKDIYSCIFNIIRLGLSIIKPIALQNFTRQVEDLIRDYLSTGKTYPPTIIKSQVCYL